MEKAIEKKQAVVRPGTVLAGVLIAAQAQGIKAKTADEAKKEEQARARELAGGAVEYVLPDGTILATDEFEAGKRRVDLERLAKDFPDAYLACVAPGDPFRKMLFKSAMTLLAGSHSKAIAKQKVG